MNCNQSSLKSFFYKKYRIIYHNIKQKMLEFLFGFIIGVWAGQSVPLPSVGNYFETFWAQKPQQVAAKVDEETGPIFTGEMHTTVPT